MSTAPEKSASTDKEKVASALLRYRVLAYTTGIWLLVLIGDMIAKYIFDIQNIPSWIPAVHGWVYLIYLILTIDLAIKVRWPVARTIGTLLAGTVPLLSFFVEHWRTTQVKRDFGL